MHNIYAALLIGLLHPADWAPYGFRISEVSLCSELRGIKHGAFSFPQAR